MGNCTSSSCSVDRQKQISSSLPLQLQQHPSFLDARSLYERFINFEINLQNTTDDGTLAILLETSTSIYNLIVDDPILKVPFTTKKFINHLFQLVKSIQTKMTLSSSSTSHQKVNHDNDDSFIKCQVIKVTEQLLCISRALATQKQAPSDVFSEARRIISKPYNIHILLDCLKNEKIRSHTIMTEVFKNLGAATAEYLTSVQRQQQSQQQQRRTRRGMNQPTRLLADNSAPSIIGTSTNIKFLMDFIPTVCVEQDKNNNNNNNNNKKKNTESNDENESAVRWGSTLINNICCINEVCIGIQRVIVSDVPTFLRQFVLPIMQKSESAPAIRWTLNILVNLCSHLTDGQNKVVAACSSTSGRGNNNNKFLETLMNSVLNEESLLSSRLTTDPKENQGLVHVAVRFLAMLIKPQHPQSQTRIIKYLSSRNFKNFLNTISKIVRFIADKSVFSSYLGLVLCLIDDGTFSAVAPNSVNPANNNNNNNNLNATGRRQSATANPAVQTTATATATATTAAITQPPLSTLSFAILRNRSFLASDAEFCEQLAATGRELIPVEDAATIHAHRYDDICVLLDLPNSFVRNENNSDDLDHCDTDIVKSMF